MPPKAYVRALALSLFASPVAALACSGQLHIEIEEAGVYALDHAAIDAEQRRQCVEGASRDRIASQPLQRGGGPASRPRGEDRGAARSGRPPCRQRRAGDVDERGLRHPMPAAVDRQLSAIPEVGAEGQHDAQRLAHGGGVLDLRRDGKGRAEAHRALAAGRSLQHAERQGEDGVLGVERSRGSRDRDAPSRASVGVSLHAVLDQVGERQHQAPPW